MKKKCEIRITYKMYNRTNDEPSSIKSVKRYDSHYSQMSQNDEVF